ncbi:MAG: energy transducer TonB [Vampirovibrionales bacterium]|nr:energy transducer TonB [Vampirovibrionales bacterium]
MIASAQQPTANAATLDPFQSNSHSLPTALAAGIRMIQLDEKNKLSWPVALGLSIASHIGVVGSIWLAAIIFAILAQLFGWQFPLFDPLNLKQRELEFVLVEAPAQKPRNPNTRLRAEKDSRAGGKKVDNLPVAQPLQKSGAPNQPQKPAPKAQPQPAKPQPQPVRQPQKPVAAVKPTPAQQPSPKPTPKAPPKPAPPSASVPKPTPSQRPVPVPPAPGAINLPSTGAPRQVSSGPVLPTTGRAGSSGSPGQAGQSGRPGPVQIPGAVSSPGGPGGAPGGGGNAGRNSTNQFGSPGGGGGPAGVDAIAEPDFGPYIAELQRRIKRNWTPPSDNRNKRIEVLFTIGRDGVLRKLIVQKSSGVEVADSAAMAAVRASSPFRPLPANYRGNEIDVQFIFDYNVYSGRGSGVSLQ